MAAKRKPRYIEDPALLDKIRKVKALMDNGGTEGEKGAAKARLLHICEKYGYTLEDVEMTLGNTVSIKDIFTRAANDFFNEKGWFRFRAVDKMELSLLAVVIKRYGGVPVGGKIRIRKIRTTYVEAEIFKRVAEQIELEYEHLRKAMRKGMTQTAQKFAKEFIYEYSK
jgi:hypothetical protein